MAATIYAYKASSYGPDNRLTAQEGILTIMPISITGTCAAGGFDISEAINKFSNVFAVLMETLQVNGDEYVGVYDATEKTLKLIKVADGAEKTSGDSTVKVVIVGDIR